ncbi:hypothetical protein HDU96_000894 [Phlyctochytrium bullatum]|nr:hypothetical protein HDU96_000894 [Phlyctochytrium bullatum]
MLAASSSLSPSSPRKERPMWGFDGSLAAVGGATLESGRNQQQQTLSRRSFFTTNWASKQAALVVAHAMGMELSGDIVPRNIVAEEASILSHRCFNALVYPKEPERGSPKEKLRGPSPGAQLLKIVKKAASYVSKPTRLNAVSTLLTLQAAEVNAAIADGCADSAYEESLADLSKEDATLLQLLNHPDPRLRDGSVRYTSSQNLLSDLLIEIGRCPYLNYTSQEALENFWNEIDKLMKPIPSTTVTEIKLCCEFLLGKEISEIEQAQASSWVREPGFEPELKKLEALGFAAYRAQCKGPVQGNNIGAHLKRLIQSIDGGLILKSLCDLILCVFDEPLSDGTLRLAPSSKPLIRAILRSTSQREEILRAIAPLGQKIIRENGVQPKQLAVVFAVSDLNAYLGRVNVSEFQSSERHRLDLKKRFERWNSVWGIIMNNFEWFLEE